MYPRFFMEGRTMKTQCMVLASLISALLLRCTTPLPKEGIFGQYSFQYEGATYLIHSLTPKYKDGYNVLIQKRGDQIVLQGIDREQDGILDELIVGEIPLEKAKEIYKKGISEAERRGNVYKKNVNREYRTTIDDYTYVVVTYLLELGSIYNRLTIMEPWFSKVEVVILDSGADGTLDKIEKGEGILEEYQKKYSLVLQRGLKEKKVIKSEGTYQVVM